MYAAKLSIFFDTNTGEQGKKNNSIALDKLFII